MFAWVLLWAGVGHAAYMIPGGTNRPKDFAFIKKDGYYHLFYIRHNVEVPTDSTEKDFGHSISNDLYHWQNLPNVVPCDTTAGSWNRFHVWAPTIVKQGDTYWMIYTGVSDDPVTHVHTQRMGAATSTDLLTWTPVPESPFFDATQAPWAWRSATSSNPAFRDPYVMPDPANPGKWLMYYTASYAPDSAATVVGIARANGDLTHWSDLGPVLETWRFYSFNPLTESPHMFVHNGLWFLFISTSAGQPLTYYTTADPTGPLAAWTYRGRLRNMLGFDTSLWFASEELRDGTHDYLSFISGDRIEVREMLWGSGPTFSLLQPALFHVQDLSWQQPRATEGDSVALRITNSNPLSGQPIFTASLVALDGTETPVPLDSLGFLQAPSLDSETYDLKWLARRYAATDSSSPMRLRIRMADSTAASQVLEVYPRPPQVVGLEWQQDSVTVREIAHVKVSALHPLNGTTSVTAWVTLGTGEEIPVPLDSLGFPGTLTLTGDTTVVPWVARRYPAVSDTNTSVFTHLRLEAQGGSAVSQELIVGAPHFHVTRMRWLGSDAISTRDTIRLEVTSVNPLGRVPVFRASLVDEDKVETPVSLDSLGFPAVPALTGDVTVFKWVARRYPRVPDTDLDTVTHLLLRLADSTAVAPLFTITSPAPPTLGVGGGDTKGPLRFAARALNTGRAGAAALEIQLSEAASVRVDLYDVLGRRLRVLADRALSQGVNVLAWDGRDGGGADVGDGVYFARVACAGRVQTVRLLNLR
jgi:beta-fructofuranosidase